MMNLPQPTPILNKLHYHTPIYCMKSPRSLSKAMYFENELLLLFFFSLSVDVCVFRAPMKFFSSFLLIPI